MVHLPAVLVVAYLTRLALAVFIPPLRAPGLLDLLVVVAAVAVGVVTVRRTRPSRARLAAAGVAVLFWANPWLSGLIHSQSASLAALAMAGVAAVIIVAPPQIFSLVAIGIAAGFIVSVVSVLYGLLSAWGWVSGAFHSVGEYERITAGIPALKGIALHPNTLGAIAGATIVLALLFTAVPRRPGTWVIPAVCLVALLWSQSRSALLGTTAALGVLVAVRWRPQLRAVAVGVALVASLTPFVVTAPLPRLLQLDGAANAVFNGRPVAWLAGSFGFLRDPVLGYGPDAFTKPFWRGIDAYWQPLHAHNEVIEVLAQAGLVGFATLLALVLVAVVAALVRPWPQALAAVVLLSFTAVIAAVEVSLGLSYFPLSYLLPTLIVAGMAYVPRLPASQVRRVGASGT